MTAPKPTDFAEYFRAVHGYEPFPWQVRLAQRACGNAAEPGNEGHWPRCIALPTAAGKTSCIDIAVFALACQASLTPEKRSAPRRIFFVVDRRVVVDQACDHAEALAEKLKTAGADGGILRRVGDALREVGADVKRPLDVYALRGGMYRESAWVRSPLQPTVITSTVDQVGSRLLFRGYGVSDSSTPLHAALVGNDALILLDEAHCARPFDQTMSLVKKYRGKDWAKEPQSLPFHFVTMTATPSAGTPENEIERLGEDDRSHAVLGKRITAKKPAQLALSNAKGDKWEKWGPPFARDLADHATSLHKMGFPGVGLIVNRVATAREAAAKLREGLKEAADVILLTGRMRPVDRDAIIKKLKPLLSNSTTPIEKPIFVVATQTIEVGADLDFHALVTECASLDALRQRFGRLNRVGARGKAMAVIVVRADQTEPVEPTKDDPDKEFKADPVYGNSLANTWKWLQEHAEDEPVEPLSTAAEQGESWGKKKSTKAGKPKSSATATSTAKVIDFGVAALDALLNDPRTRPDDLTALNAPSPDAAVLLPAHLDMWCQTSPRPVPDPDPSYFLHGPQRGEPQVQVVFRADLGDDADKWAEIVSLCPPSSSEALSVRLRDFARWLKGEMTDEASSDVEGQRAQGSSKADDENADPTPARRRSLRWRGPDACETSVVSDDERATPNDLFVVPITTDEQRAEAATLGDFPINEEGTPRITDAGDEAFQRSRDKAILRLTPACFPKPPAPQAGSDARADGVRAGDHPDAKIARIVEHLSKSAGEADDETFDAEQSVRDALKKMKEVESTRTDVPPRAWLLDAIKALLKQDRLQLEPHPVLGSGFVVFGRERLHQFDPTFIEPEESWEAASDRPYPLADHCRDVASLAGTNAERSGVNEAHAAIKLAGELHDVGKADPRFQAWLHSGNARRAAACATLYAKSVVPVRSRSELLAFRDRARYPTGARHELYSTWMAAHPPNSALAGIDPALHDLVLHLIASHHGSCRPFAPIATGDLDREKTIAASNGMAPLTIPRAAEPFTLRGEGRTLTFTPDSSISGHGLERLDCGVAERFWMLTRRYGWWGLPYLEALLRLADWACCEPRSGSTDNSAHAANGKLLGSKHRTELAGGNAMSHADQLSHPITLTGLDGQNPLGFLAALGALATCDRTIRTGAPRMDWIVDSGTWRPRLHSSIETDKQLVERLAAELPQSYDSTKQVWEASTKLPFAASEFHDLCRELVSGACPDNRLAVDLLAALGVDVLTNDKGEFLDTSLRMVRSGDSGGNGMPAYAAWIVKNTETEHLRQVFDAYAPPDEGTSLRWDPAELRTRALQWGDPSKEKVLSRRGLNRLALEALGLFPTVPMGAEAVTVGFARMSDIRGEAFTWPIWTRPLPLSAARSLLMLAVLRDQKPDPQSLAARGVAAVFRSVRFASSKYYSNFAPAQAI